MATETIWLVPDAKNLDTLMSQLVLNAGEKSQVEMTGDDPQERSKGLLAHYISQIRATIAVAKRMPLSQLANSVPPEGELHAYVLAINALTAARPNLGSVVVGMNGGVFSPWNDLVKQARAWMDAVRLGKLLVTAPVNPVVDAAGDPVANYAIGGEIVGAVDMSTD